MSSRLESLEREKQVLLDRSALCRVHLRREARAVRGSLTLGRATTTAAPAARVLAWSAAVSLMGMGRTARLLLLAGRILFIAKLARAAIGYARGTAKPTYLL